MIKEVVSVRMAVDESLQVKKNVLAPRVLQGEGKRV